MAGCETMPRDRGIGSRKKRKNIATLDKSISEQTRAFAPGLAEPASPQKAPAPPPEDPPDTPGDREVPEAVSLVKEYAQKEAKARHSMFQFEAQARGAARMLKIVNDRVEDELKKKKPRLKLATLEIREAAG